MTRFSISSSECSIVWTYWSTLSHHLSPQAESKWRSSANQLFFIIFYSKTNFSCCCCFFFFVK